MAMKLLMVIASLQFLALYDAKTIANENIEMSSLFGANLLAARFPRQQHAPKESGYKYTTHHFQQTVRGILQFLVCYHSILPPVYKHSSSNLDAVLHI